MLSQNTKPLVVLLSLSSVHIWHCTNSPTSTQWQPYKEDLFLFISLLPKGSWYPTWMWSFIGSQMKSLLAPKVSQIFIDPEVKLNLNRAERTVSHLQGWHSKCVACMLAPWKLFQQHSVLLGAWERKPEIPSYRIASRTTGRQVGGTRVSHGGHKQTW